MLFLSPGYPGVPSSYKYSMTRLAFCKARKGFGKESIKERKHFDPLQMLATSCAGLRPVSTSVQKRVDRVTWAHLPADTLLPSPPSRPLSLAITLPTIPVASEIMFPVVLLCGSSADALAAPPPDL